MTVEQQLQSADEHERAGRLGEAEKICRSILAQNPNHPEALNRLGMLALRTARIEAAIAAFSKAIESRPNWAAPRINLGQLFREQGRMEETCLAFQQAVQCEANNVEALSYFATALADLHRFQEATTAIDRASVLSPNSALIHEARGMILSRAGRGAEAVGSFRRAVEIAPDVISGWFNLGVALSHVGQFAEAADCARQILLLEAGATQAYSLMASVGAGVTLEEMSRLTASLDDLQISIRDRAKLAFALGKMLDDADRFDEAFAHFDRGNALVRQMRSAAGARYNPYEFARRVDESIALFTLEFFAHTRDWGEPSQLPIFIVGMPRSGTSLVEQIAASHPDVYGAGEMRDIGNIAKSLSSTKGRPGPIKDAAHRHLAHLQSLGGFASRVTDKMPANVERLGLIATLFPSARIIFCRRDPRDTCVSCFFQNFIGGNLFSFDLAHCGRHHVQTDRLIAHWQKVLPLPMLEVQYDQLVADLESQSRRIIGFLDLPWNPACLSFHKTDRTTQTISAWQVRQPIYTRSVGRWRNYERHLGPLFQALGP